MGVKFRLRRSVTLDKYRAVHRGVAIIVTFIIMIYCLNYCSAVVIFIKMNCTIFKVVRENTTFNQ